MEKLASEAPNAVYLVIFFHPAPLDIKYCKMIVFESLELTSNQKHDDRYRREAPTKSRYWFWVLIVLEMSQRLPLHYGRDEDNTQKNGREKPQTPPIVRDAEEDEEEAWTVEP